MNPVIEYVMHKNAQQQDKSLTCLHYMEQAGHFNVFQDSSIPLTTGVEEMEVIGTDRQLEDKWRHAYDNQNE